MGKRFYPQFIPPFIGEPNHKNIAIIQAEDTGEGLITLIPVKAGEIVFTFTGVMLSEQTLYTLQHAPGHFLHDPFVMGKVLHSCNPNMLCDMQSRTFTASCDIKPGEYLTMDYETTEDELFRPFICCCGSDNCRHWIRGRAYQTKQEDSTPLVANC